MFATKARLRIDHRRKTALFTFRLFFFRRSSGKKTYLAKEISHFLLKNRSAHVFIIIWCEFERKSPIFVDITNEFGLRIT